MESKSFKVFGVDTTLAYLPFTIGGVTYDIPELNLAGERVAMTEFEGLQTHRDFGSVMTAYMKIIAARAESVEGLPLTLDFMNARMLRKERDPFMAQVKAWLTESGFLKPEGEKALVEETATPPATPQTESTPLS